MNTSKKGKYNSPWQATLQGIRDRFKKEGEEIELPVEIDLSGKTVMITGASSGLGWATAVRCARAGANIIMVNRSGFPEKIDELKSESGQENISGYKVDLSDLDQVKGFLDKLVEDHIELDLLISNAAMVPLQARKSPQGLEEMFVVNFLAAFYIVHEIVKRRIIREGARIIIVSSESHRNAEGFAWETFGAFTPYTMKETVARYGYFKLLLTTFAMELSRRTVAEGISIRSLCPGPVNSNIAREAPGWMQPLLKLSFSLFFRSPEKASDPVMYFASAKDPGDFDYLFLMRRKEIDEKASDVDSGSELWDKSSELLESLGYPLTK